MEGRKDERDLTLIFHVQHLLGIANEIPIVFRLVSINVALASLHDELGVHQHLSKFVIAF